MKIRSTMIAAALVAIGLCPALLCASGQEVLFVPYGDGANNVGLIDQPEREYAGPVTFTVDGDSVFIADSVHERIVKSAGDGKVTPFATGIGAASICADGSGGLWAQEGPQIVHVDAKGKRQSAKSVKAAPSGGTFVEGYGVELLRAPDGSVDFRTLDQKSDPIAAGEKSTGDELTYTIKRMNGNQVRILGITANGKVLVSVPVDMDGGTAGAALFKGTDDAGNLYVELERIEPDGAKLEVQRYDRKGDRLAVYTMNNNYFTTVYRKTEVTPDGSVYQMLTSSDGVHVIKFGAEVKQ